MAIADVELDGQRHRIDWPPQSTLVDVMMALASTCHTHAAKGGAAHACAAVVSGEVDMAPNDVLEPEDRQTGLILACQSRPVSDTVHIEF